MSLNKKTIADVLSSASVGDEIQVSGWVQAFRNQRFIALNDGSTAGSLQIVIEPENMEETLLKRIGYHACLRATGKLMESPAAGQAVEVHASKIEILGDNPLSEYPLQPKRMTMEFLREHAAFRLRTRTLSSVFRLRHGLGYAIHKYFHENRFYYLHTPIITGSDAEGAGEMFRVTTLDISKPPRTETGEIDWKQDFFGHPTNLTVSGQLQAETGALALGRVYTFGPTFRAEKSNTPRHLAEFWMIEPEAAFFDLQDDMDLAEDFLKYLIRYALEQHAEDLAFLDKRIEQEERNMKKEERRPMGLLETLHFVIENPFERITYTEAIRLLQNSKPYKKGRFQFPVEWGRDLQAEHERWLVEKKFARPVIVTDYPKDIKAFYMRLNEDGQTVAAMDVLFPGIGEVIGGSQREERYEMLEQRMKEMNIPPEEMQWYLNLRKFGGAPHAGFGLGFERLVQFVSGMSNIRDVIAFPRYPGHAEF